ncbi:MAG TPA: oligosaccharide flippase family protein [Pseudosphingobacterium sp.]|nr:oligosaccharide flippase family protein [Pseudosphingobacterium sp.]
MNIKAVISHGLFKSSLIYALVDSINKAIPFFLLPILTYYLTPVDYGIATNYNVFISILLVFVGLSVQGAISVNFHKVTQVELRKYISNAIIVISIALLVTISIVAFLKPYLINFLKIPVYYLYFGCIVAYFQAITAINMVLWQLQEKPLLFGIYQLSQTSINVLLSLLFIIYYRYGWKGRVDAQNFSAVIYGVLSIFIIYKRGYFQFSFKRAYLNDVVIFTLPLIPHALSIWIRSAIDRVYITNLVGSYETGIYATGFQFGLLVSFLTLAFNNAFVPFLYKRLETQDLQLLERIKRQLVKITYIYILGILMMSGVLTLISYYVINHFLSQEYVRAKEFVSWAILAQAFQGMYLMVANYIFYRKKTAKLAYITFSCSLLQACLSYFCIKQLGAIGGAYSTVVVSLVNFLAVWAYSSNVYKMPWFKRL